MQNNIFNNTIAEHLAGSLLNKEKLRRVAHAPLDTAIKMLIEYGYEGDFTDTDIDEFIKKQLDNLIWLVNEHVELQHLKSFLLKRFSIENAEQLNSINLENAKKLGNYYASYVRTEIDQLNILTSFRAARLGFSEDGILAELISGGTIDIKELAANAANGADCLFDGLNDTVYETSIDYLKKGNFALFRKLCQILLFNILEKEFNSFLGIGPFVKYFLAKLNEIKNIKFILVCLKNDMTINVDELWGVHDE